MSFGGFLLPPPLLAFLPPPTEGGGDRVTLGSFWGRQVRVSHWHRDWQVGYGDGDGEDEGV